MDVLAACHVHSVWSYDGSWQLKDLGEAFRRRGYRVLMMTEHDRGFTAERWSEYRAACAEASSDEVLVVPGMEYSDAENRVHVLVWGNIPFLGEGLPTSEMLAGMRAAGGLAVLAHPSRRDAWKSFQPSWADALLGVELWNRKYDGWGPSKTAPQLLETTGAVQFVGLDFHTDRQFFPLGMALHIQKEVSEESVLDSLRQRQCKPRAFDLPVGHGMVRGIVPFLNVAERVRRAGASMVRRVRKPKRQQKATS
jgi:hypothetical protein